MRALITNDDGVHSTGIAVLARVAARAGYDTVLAAPSWDSSGASASITAVEDHGRFLVEPCVIPGFDGESYAVEAAPAFIVRAGMHGAFGDAPEVVLSGVNRGVNTGHAILHSGTVGAASTATIHGARAAAFSVDAHEDADWETVEEVVERVLEWFGTVGIGLINVNIPDLARSELREVVAAPLAARGAVSTTITEVGEGYVTLDETEPGPAEPGTDAALVAEGHVTVTALQPTCECPGVVLDGLADVLPSVRRGPQSPSG